MEPELSLDDVRARTDAPAGLVQDCIEAGLFGTGRDPPGFERLDVERLRLVGFPR